jgi:hypothetical protein
MKRSLVVVLGAAICVTPIVAIAQQTAKAPGAKTFKAPRNAFGQPDLGGQWTNATITPVARPAQYGERRILTEEEVKRLEGASAANVEAGNRSTDPNAAAPEAGGNVGGYNRGWLDPGTQVMRVNGEPRTAFLTTPTGQFPVRKAGAPAGAGRGGAAAGGRGGQFDNPEQRPLGERCIISFGRNAGPPMLPNGFYNNNYHIVQSKDSIAIGVEMVHDVRVVRLGGTHRTDGVRPWMGDSIGRYDGDTLVVETINLPQRQAYQGAWQNLKVTEKFTRVGPGRIRYQFILDDPTIWNAPWGGEYEFAALQGDIREYACHEGNYALDGILAGAREAERIAREARASATPTGRAGGTQ